MESKWDNHSEFNNEEYTLREEQELRHKIFSWYLSHWSKKYSNNWQAFIDEQQNSFMFKDKTVASKDSLLAKNLEHILGKLQEHCESYPSENNIKNVLLFFYNAEKSKPPTKTNNIFTLVPIEYSREFKGNFVTL